jgi:hypothetical protein
MLDGEHALKTIRMFGFFVILLAACSSGSGQTWDTGLDSPADQVDLPGDAAGDVPADMAFDPGPDSAADPVEDGTDLPADAPAEETPAPAAFGALSCTSVETCCTTTACGSYPDRWTCDDGFCRGTGCLSDAECAAWAAGYGLPGAEDYKCRGPEGGYRSCVPGCIVAQDCCNPYTDCTRYPYRYQCSDGGCVLDGCLGDDECRTYAAEVGLFRPDLYVCRDLGLAGWFVCFQSCTSEADCCNPAHAPCTAYPFHYECRDSVCSATCDSDAECQAYAAASSLPHPELYVCRSF